MSAERLRPIRDQPVSSPTTSVRPSANIARYLPGFAIDSRTPSSQSAGFAAGGVTAMFRRVGCSNSDARRKSVPPQFGHWGIDSAGSKETGNEQPWQMKDPTPPAVSPAWWTSSALCPRRAIRGFADGTRRTANWLVEFVQVVRKVHLFQACCRDEFV